MPVLTWRDVAQPDFGSAIAGQKYANDAMNNAFASLGGALSSYRGAEQDQADRNITNRALTYQDPEAYKAALANGTIVGPDGNLAHTPFLQSLPNQATTMIGNALTQAQTGKDIADTGQIGATTASIKQQTETNQYNQQRAVAHNALTDALGPVTAPLLADVTDLASFQKNQAAFYNSDQFKALPPDLQQAAANAFNTEAANKVGAPNNVYGATQVLKEGMRSQAVKDVVSQVLRAGNTEAGRTIWQNSGLDPQGMEQAHEAIKATNAFPDWETPKQSLQAINTPLVGLPGANPNDQWREFATYKGPNGAMPVTDANGQAIPYSKATVGQTLANGDRMIKQTKGTIGQGPDVGTSAQTPMMFTNETLRQYAPKALGSNWMSQPLTPENQNKITAAILQDRNTPEKLAKTWVALKPEDIQTIAASKYDPNIAIPLIISRENGMNLNSVMDTMFGNVKANQTMNRALAQSSSQPGVADYAKYSALTGTTDDIANKLLSDPAESVFKGVPQAQLSDYIQTARDQLAAKTGDKAASAGLAALALKMSMINGNPASAHFGNLVHNALNWTSPYHQETFASGYRLDPSKLDDNFSEVTQPDMAERSLAYEKQKATAGMQVGVEQDYGTRLNTAKQAAASYFAHPENEGYRDAYIQAMRQLGGASNTMRDFTNQNVNGILKPSDNVPPQKTPTNDVSSILQNVVSRGNLELRSD